MDDENFKMDVIDRLARIEEKLKVIPQNCKDIDMLKDDNIKTKTEKAYTAKLAKIAITGLSALSTVLVIAKGLGWI